MSEISALLLDDDFLSIDLLMKEVDWRGCGIGEVHGVSSVRKAKDFLKAHTVNLLICDIEMPGESGLDLVELSAEDAGFSSDPMVCIMLTCHPDYQYLRRALLFGCQDYLLKPADFAELHESIQKAVRTIRKKQQELGILPAEKSPSEAGSGADLVRSRILPYIEENLASSFSVEDLARMAMLNPHYLMRIFKKETGSSILEYVQDLKMQRAREMLTYTGWSVETIAEKLGYGTSSYFYKCFKKHEGMTPREYRRQAAQEEG